VQQVPIFLPGRTTMLKGMVKAPFVVVHPGPRALFQIGVSLKARFLAVFPLVSSTKIRAGRPALLRTSPPVQIAPDCSSYSWGICTVAHRRIIAMIIESFHVLASRGVNYTG
jgi:hypothetical protein